jgi:flagellar export protein FliJ
VAVARKFRFSLARVLSVRETEFNLQKQAFALANRRLGEAVAALASLERDHDAHEASLAQLRTASELRIDDCLERERWIQWARAQIVAARRVVTAREAERESALEAFRAAQQRLRVLERLQESRRLEHAQERRAQESKTIDEVASQRSRASGADAPDRYE